MNHISFTDRAPIVIQGALDSELDLLLNTFTLLQTRKVGSFEFHECIYKNRHVVISKTKIGEICSAIATTLAIQTYHPTLILNQGTAGALVDWLNTGDIIAGKRVCYLSEFSTDTMRDAEAINPWKSDAYRSCDGDILSYDADPAILKTIARIFEHSAQEIHFDVIGSGDVWTKDPQKIHEINRSLGAVCECMECAGAYLSANSLGTPIVSIRAISNNELKAQTYDQASGALAQKFVLSLLDRLLL